MVTLAVSVKRAGQVRTAIAITLPVTWIFSIPLATVGGCLVSGAYFLAVGYLLTEGAVERSDRAIPAAAGR